MRSNPRKPIRPSVRKLAALCCSLSLLGLVPTAAEAGAQTIPHGGTLTVIDENILWETLDPAYNTHDLLGVTYANALYGELFYQLPNKGIGFGFATGDKLTNGGKTFSFTIRPGVKFSDGTPYNAQAVAYNINRDLGQPSRGGLADFEGLVRSVKASGGKVVMQLTRPDVAIAEEFVNDTLDWIASPTAIKKEGKAAFATHPVGAGPFEVKSFTPDSKIVLVRNPHYYIKGEPYLNGITVLTTMVDQSAYSALQAGSAELVQGITTPSIISEAKKSLNVTLVPSQFATNLELNTYKPPFNNIDAREAVAFAINPKQIFDINSPGLGETEEGIVGPGGNYYEKTVSGYRGYNPPKAKALVKKLGGLSFTIEGGTSPAASTELASLQAELRAVGITVKLLPMQLPEEESRFFAGNWQAVTSQSGGPDPEVGSQDLQERYSTKGPYTCCKNGKLDSMITSALETSNTQQRSNALKKIYSDIVSEHYVVPLYSAPNALVYSKSLRGVTVAPGLEANGITLPLATMYFGKGQA